MTEEEKFWQEFMAGVIRSIGNEYNRLTIDICRITARETGKLAKAIAPVF